MFNKSVLLYLQSFSKNAIFEMNNKVKNLIFCNQQFTVVVVIDSHVHK